MNKQIDQNVILQERVMDRVHSIFYMRTVVRPLLVKSAVFFAGTFVAFMSVSLSHIISNMYQAQVSIFFYLFKAFTNTEFIMQVMLLLLCALAVWMARDIHKMFVLRKKIFAH